MTREIIHNKKICRFETIEEGITGYVEYEQYAGGIDITHTIVPKPIGGRGIAADLVKEALEYAKENGMKVIPTCSYVKVFLERYKEQYGELEDKKDAIFPTIEGSTGHTCGVKKPKIE